MGHFGPKFQAEGMVRRQPFSVFPKLDRMAFHAASKYGRKVCLFVTKHAFDRRTNGRTDGQNFDRQDRAWHSRRTVKMVSLTLRDFEAYFG